MKSQNIHIQINLNGEIKDYITFHNASVSYECAEYFKVESDLNGWGEYFQKPNYSYYKEGVYNA